MSTGWSTIGVGTSGVEPSGSERAVESMPIGLIVLAPDWRVVYINAAGEAVVGYTRHELVGRSYWDAFPANVDNAFGRTYRNVVATGRPQLVEAFYPEPLNRWFEVRAVPSPTALSLYFTDVTQRRQAQERLALLARVGAELAAGLDASSAARRVPALVVPTLASWCTVTLRDEDGTLRRVGSWHADPAIRPLVEQYADAAARSPSATSPLARAMRSGAPVVEVGIRPPDEAAPHREAIRPLVEQLGPGTRTVLPIRGRERILGAVMLGHDPRRAVDQGDISTAQQVADRLGAALDNARLYEQQRRLAEVLQRSMLTAPPRLDVAEIAVRYLPASKAARVGGDWYDAFVSASGSTILVIGDVVGHDTAATAAMGQLRSLLRGIAVATDAGPAVLLTALDAAMAQLRVDTYATVALARLDRTPDGGAQMTWANAGHPSPLVLSPEGDVHLPGGWRGELMLGVDAGAARTESVLPLPPGATVVLYSDGLLERRDRDLDDGVARLRTAAGELAHHPLEAFCDGLLDRLVEGRPEDDVAVVALRINR